MERISLNTVSAVRRLHQSIFPVAFGDKFYKEIVDNELSGILHVNTKLAAVVSCSFMISDCQKVLYIQALGVLPYYREQGLGSQLLRFVESKADEHNAYRIMLHVQVNNSAAISFYSKRGFSINGTCLNYYKRCSPSDAYIMIKDI